MKELNSYHNFFSFWLCLWDLSSLTREPAWAIAVKVQNPNHYATRELPCYKFFLLLSHTEVESQEITEVTGKFGLGVQNEAGQRLIEFCKRMRWS